MKKIFLLVLLLPVLHLLRAQNRIFNVMMDEKKIGEISAEKIEKGLKLQYRLSSNIETTIVFKVQVSSATATDYEKGLLVKTVASRTSNMPGETKQTAVEWKGTAYAITKGSDVSVFPTLITFCISDLYFKEPFKIPTVFSEIQALPLPLKDLGNHSYEVTHPTGKKDIYVYEKGKLQRVETVIGMYKVQFVAR